MFHNPHLPDYRARTSPLYRASITAQRKMRDIIASQRENIAKAFAITITGEPSLPECERVRLALKHGGERIRDPKAAVVVMKLIRQLLPGMISG